MAGYQMHDPFAAGQVGQNNFGSPMGVPSYGQSPQQQQHQQQQQTSNPNENPFAAYSQQPATAAMVPATQAPNQWGMPMQQQQPPMNAGASYAGASYNGVNMTAPQPGYAPQQQSQGYPQQMHPQQQQNPYNMHSTNQAAMQPPAPTEVVSSPSQPTVVSTTAEDDDFFGAFSSKPISPVQVQPEPPSEFETRETQDNVSVLSKSTAGRSEGGKSPLDDPSFAPKPNKIAGLQNAMALARNAPPGASKLPNFDLVTHSGYCLSRISFRTILIKKWKQVFWVVYGSNQVLFFRSNADFEDWASNPYLSNVQREFLVKLKIDFVEDLYQANCRGYQVTSQRLKAYQNKMLHQFKLERWMDYGPTIAAAFASSNENEVNNLRTVFSEMMKRSPQNNSSVRLPSNPYVSAETVNRYNNNQYRNSSNANSMYFASSASAGMIEANSVNSGRSSRSQLTGHYSTGPVERSTIPVSPASGFHY